MTAAALRDPRKPSIADYRHMLREHFGSRKYRIDRYGNISVYGQMPNSIETGWWLYGAVGESDTMSRLFGDTNL